MSSSSATPRSYGPTESHADALTAFVSDSPSSYHAVQAMLMRLEKAGFAQLFEEESWTISPGGKYVVVRDGAAIAWAVPESIDTAKNSTSEGTELVPLRFTVIGAHTDSPGFKLKPSPDFVAEDTLQAGVEIYGAPLLNSWLDRELKFAGRLTLTDGTTALACTGPVARIPQLAIHLDRSVNETLTLEKQKHMQPVVGMVEGGDTEQPELRSLVLGLLADSAGVAASEIAGYDVVTIPAQEAAVFGAHNEFLASPRLDNLASVYAATEALAKIDTLDSTGISMVAAFDHEEVGSGSRSGAAGPFLADLTQRIVESLLPNSRHPNEDYLRTIARSICISSDAGHAVHPNYPRHHDPVNRPRLGRGPLLKINAQQRYSTDSVGQSRWDAACRAAGVEYQAFVSNNDIACGTTIGPLTAARLGMTTVDIGPALWSMHSAREMCAVSDIEALHDAIAASFRL